MEEKLDSRQIGELVNKTSVPILLRNVCDWNLLKWSLDDWIERMPDNELPFRFKPKKNSSEPHWERKCSVRDMTLKNFFEFDPAGDSDEWGYFDYKYIHEWLKPDNEICKQISWDSFGFADRSAADSTLWIGNKGAHTPCHQDTYGRNIVVQAYGKKMWLLFPPESGNMKPTRVPYEESSIYSQLNFSTPADLDDFKRISGCRMVILEPGDVLIVPPMWWHYVEHVSPIGISINIWISSDKEDAEHQLKEALIRLLVAQITKDLPEKLSRQILNPNEEDLVDLPLTVAILQVEATAKKCLEYKSKRHGAKRLKLDPSERSDKSKHDNEAINVEETCQKYGGRISIVEEISNEKLMDMLRDKINDRNSSEGDEGESENVDNNLSTSIINAFCQPDVINMVKDNLLQNLTV